MEDNWISVYTTEQAWQAEIAKQILSENGIDAVVINKRDSSLLTFGEVKVYVSQENSEKSKELLKPLSLE